MNAYIITLTVIGLYLAAVLFVFVTGRLITRTDLYRRWAETRGKQYPRSRMIEDLRPVQQTMIDFINASSPSGELLQRLAEVKEPIPARKLLASVPEGESSWTALFLMALAGLVSFGRDGVSLTAIGREILTRMNVEMSKVGQETADFEPPVPEESLPATVGKNGTEGISHLELVREALDRNERARFAGPTRTIRGFELGQLRAPAPFPANDSHVRSSAEHKSPAIVTAADQRELSAAIVAARKLAAYEGETQVLQEKLAHAIISTGGKVPPDVITMYSRAELLDVGTGEQINVMLVFPIDANLEQGRISVFHPLGAAMLGRRVGDRFDWIVPYGFRRFDVKAVEFQPEAALAKAA
jgi:regulator of nucleoside diphosphate kinase